MKPAIQAYKPTEKLRPFIKNYISIQFPAQGLKIWLPADLRNQLFIIKEGQAFVQTNKESYQQPAVSIRGSFTKPMEISFTGNRIDAFVIEFTEIGLASLLLNEASVVINTFRDIQQVCDPPVINFFKNHQEQADIAFIQSFEAFVGRKALSHKAQVTNESLSHIKQAQGSIRVTDLAKKVNTHPKTLRRYVKTFTGLNLREFLQLYRFHVACKTALLNGKTDHSPYFDQSHFIREFSKYSGVLPSKVSRIDNSWMKYLLENDLF